VRGSPRHTRDPGLPGSFRLLIAAWAGSLSGDGLRVVALPLLAKYIDPTPAAVAAVAVASTLPWLLVAVPAGAIADRMNAARIVMAAHLVRGVVTFALMATILTGSATIPLLCLVGFVITAAETFSDSASQSLLVRAVPAKSLELANARFVTVETIALDLVGPLVGGALFVVARWLPFAVSGLLFLVSALIITPLIRLPELAPEPEPGGTRRRLHVASGLRALVHNPTLRVLVVTVAVMAVGNAAVDGQLVLYATGNLGMSDAVYPTLLAAYSVGTLIAAAFVGKISARFRGGPVMMLALAGLGGTMLLMGLFPHAVVAWICYAAMGLAGGTWNVLSATRRQRSTRRDMVARVSSAFRVIAWGVNPLGGALGGVVGEVWSVPTVFAGAGVMILLWGVVVTRSFVRPANEPPPGGWDVPAPGSGQRG
jgi:MFS family permease